MGTVDEIKGRIKEAAGVLTGSKDLKREGKADRATGKAKDAVDAVQKKTSEVADSISDRAHEATSKAKTDES